MTKQKRATNLIANFDPDPITRQFRNTFAPEWKMAVGKWFKDALDIKLTARVINGKKENIWTQGKVYSFDTGDIFYDSEKAYSNSCWRDSLSHITVAVQILLAIPVQYIEATGGLSQGRVQAQILRKDSTGTRLVHDGGFDCSQNEFVELLKSGEVVKDSGKKINLFPSKQKKPTKLKGMTVIYHHEVTAPELPKDAIAETHLLCVEIADVHQHAVDLISEINETSWISKLNSVGRMSYERTAHRTIKALVEIFQLVENDVTKEFGQYMVSISASEGLRQRLTHRVIPISELWKGRTLGNDAFDFHTESMQEKISFGEAKYTRQKNSYSRAAEQVIDFINDGKDYGDASDLVHFVSPNAMKNLENRSRGFAVAFSLHSKNHVKIMNNTLRSEWIQQLSAQCNELYIIGVRA